MFYFTLDHQNIAYQVAGLVNDYNGLSHKRYENDILHGKTDYIVETHGKLVIGAVGLHRQSYTFTEVKHLVVRPEWRSKGVAKFLLRRAMGVINTKMAYATVRDDNEASLKLFESFGFRRAGKYPAEDHQVELLVRVSPQWEQIQSSSKSTWLDASTSINEVLASKARFQGLGVARTELDS